MSSQHPCWGSSSSLGLSSTCYLLTCCWTLWGSWWSSLWLSGSWHWRVCLWISIDWQSWSICTLVAVWPGCLIRSSFVLACLTHWQWCSLPSHDSPSDSHSIAIWSPLWASLPWTHCCHNLTLAFWCYWRPGLPCFPSLQDFSRNTAENYLSFFQCNQSRLTGDNWWFG